MNQLGHLMWWKVSDLTLDQDALYQALVDTKLGATHRPSPIDVFRRITREMKGTYPLEGGDTLEIAAVHVDASSDKMLTRHLVGTVTNDRGVVQAIRKVGDATFYKPPRGQHSKARLRIVAMGPFPREAEIFASQMRTAYDEGVQGFVTGQAVRQLVRKYLAKQGAIYLGGPYFIERPEQAEALVPIFKALGERSFMHIVPLVDTPEQREFLENRRRAKA